MCQGIPLATKGIIYCPEIVSSGCTRYVMPINLNLTKDVIKLNLTLLDTIKFYAKLDVNKLKLAIPTLKLNQKITNNLKLNLKKCEE